MCGKVYREERFYIDLQDKEDIDKVNNLALTETFFIKAEIKSTIALVNNMDQGKKCPIESLNYEVEIMMREIMNYPILDQWP